MTSQVTRSLIFFKDGVGIWAMCVFLVLHDRWNTAKMTISLDEQGYWAVDFSVFVRSRTYARQVILPLYLLSNFRSTSVIEQHARLISESIVEAFEEMLTEEEGLGN